MPSTKPVFALPVADRRATKEGLDAEVNRVIDLIVYIGKKGL